jgi:hypothetical protein
MLSIITRGTSTDESSLAWQFRQHYGSLCVSDVLLANWVKSPIVLDALATPPGLAQPLKIFARDLCTLAAHSARLR